MSELKVIDLGNIREAIENDESVYYEYYAKSEADKVIEELKDKLHNVSGILNETREWLIESQKLHKRCADNAVKIIRHNKYKRCLDKARWCNYWAHYCEGCEPSDCGMYIVKARFYRGWRNRWLKMAEQFKEAK